MITEKGQRMTYGAFDNTAGLSGGTIQGLGANSQLLSSDGRYKNLTLSGTLAVTQVNRIDTEGTLTNTDTLTLTGGAGPSMNLLADTTLAGPGTTVLNNASLYGSPATLTVGAGQTLRGGGNLYLSGVNNQGTIQVGAAQKLFAPGLTLQQTAASTSLKVDGAFSLGALTPHARALLKAPSGHTSRNSTRPRLQAGFLQIQQARKPGTLTLNDCESDRTTR